MKALRKFDPAQAEKSYALFKKKGELPYVCRLHPVMHGVVVVK